MDASAVEDLLLLQRTPVQFPTAIRQLTMSVTAVPGHVTPFYSLPVRQKHMLHRHTCIQDTYTHKMNTKVIFKTYCITGF